MAKAKRKAPSPIEQLETPTAAQMANGDYARETIIHADTFKRATVHINRGGTPVMRWWHSGRLTDSQMGAINLCARAWQLAGINQRVTANYGERIPGLGNAESRIATEREARDDLARFMGYVPRDYWNIFENVCRFGEPAGVAGGRLGFGDRTGDARAHTIVCFVADVIAMREGL